MNHSTRDLLYPRPFELHLDFRQFASGSSLHTLDAKRPAIIVEMEQAGCSVYGCPTTRKLIVQLINNFVVRINKPIHLDFIVDRFTKSIQNTISGDSFATEVVRFTKTDTKQVTITNGWNFNWKTELADNAREVFKLTISSNPNIIQGLLSLSLESDHVYIHLLENAPFNIGQNKLYEGVAGNLVAHACKVSFQQGFDGFVVFTAKTKLIDHYQTTLRAHILGGNRMIIPTRSAQVLIDQYFKS